MNLTLKRHENEGVLILDLIGDIILGPEDALFRSTLETFANAGENRLVLNCRQLGELDSAGLGTLLLFCTRLREAGGNVVLLDVSPAHMKVFLLLKLETALQVFVIEGDAVDSFFPDRMVKSFDVLEFVHRTAKPGEETAETGTATGPEPPQG